mgnify:CR=1 FL=1
MTLVFSQETILSSDSKGLVCGGLICGKSTCKGLTFEGLILAEPDYVRPSCDRLSFRKPIWIELTSAFVDHDFLPRGPHSVFPEPGL